MEKITTCTINLLWTSFGAFDTKKDAILLISIVRDLQEEVADLKTKIDNLSFVDKNFTKNTTQLNN